MKDGLHVQLEQAIGAAEIPDEKHLTSQLDLGKREKMPLMLSAE